MEKKVKTKNFFFTRRVFIRAADRQKIARRFKGDTYLTPVMQNRLQYPWALLKKSDTLFHTEESKQRGKKING